MRDNPNVSLCCGNYSIEGIATAIGDWNDDANKVIEDIYIEIHKNSYDFYGSLRGQIVYKVVPKQVKIWKYMDDLPLRERIDFIAQKAERYECGNGSMMEDFHKRHKIEHQL